MAIPAFTIHTTVDVSTKIMAKDAFKTVSEGVRKWTPSILGLALIPFLPIVDEPVEHFVHEAFHKYWHLESISK